MKPKIETKKRLSVIWILPIVALVIGIWMVVHTKMSKGPVITISFETAEGVVAGKTKIKYLNVNMGQVEDVTLNQDMDGVLLTVQLDPEAKHLLREDTDFWVVRARVGGGSVSGLGTLLGGAYIELSPGEKAIGKHDAFSGLETPPLTPTGAPGLKLNLYSDKAGSVSAGDVVLYNGYKVGRVEGMGFDEQRKQVHYDVFIDAPFDQLVNSSVRFWNVSGVEINASASGIEVLTGSLDTVLLGGVAFGIPDGLEDGGPVDNDAEFKLFDTYSDMQEQPFYHHLNYVMEFEQSLRGLLPGAPVEYRGIPVGYVKDILFDEVMAEEASDSEDNRPIPVLIRVEPGRVGLPDTKESVEIMKASIARNVEAGMRGSLETGSMITGSLFINIDYRTDAAPASLGATMGYATIPTVQVGLDKLEEQISSFLTKINSLPLDETMSAINGTMTAMTDTLNSMDSLVQDIHDQKVGAELVKTLEDTQRILRSFGPGSSAYQSIEGSMNKLNETLYNVEALTRTLNDTPNALVLPMNYPEDPQPGANN
ncbi:MULTISPECIES: intermembrane transport protein PqiB [unclassified Lentimonas]|uniref:intermembrane transport protein PqiB n=1 Tax=unclassified Lentimonas TaxID=2630993 RepID=UPI001389E26A|nr:MULTISPECIES: intermembrane transport protein PqiB [unclassified Lentimonas]